MTYMFILKCALKLVLKNILYYDARSEKHQIKGKKFMFSYMPPSGVIDSLLIHLVPKFGTKIMPLLFIWCWV